MNYQEKPSLDELDELMHYGMPKRSGRYPWGSGDDPYQHSGDFLSRVKELKKNGLKETEIAKYMGVSTTQLRAYESIAKSERRALEVETAQSLRDRGYSLNEIAKEMGYANDSSVRSLLNENSAARMNQARTTADFLKKQIEEKGYLDVGKGVELELGISKEKLEQALVILEAEGMPNYSVGVEQQTNKGKQTSVRVLCPPGTEHKDVYGVLKDDASNIKSVKDYDQILTEDGTKVRAAFEYPASMDSKRLKVRYAEEGGIDKDGVIELRRGVDDLSLGNSHYAQVRILVDNDRYLKGMAVYSDNMPDGVDVIFNTNKKSDVAMRDVLKKVKDDPDNPFGSLLKEHGGQSYYIDKDGKEKLSLINKTREEGDWGEWSKELPSQFLSKQSLSLAKKQLGEAASDRQAEFDAICALNNPTVKKKLLQSFADDCDAAAVHLKAAALPRQRYQVIMPVTSMKDTEVYAPNYKDGEQVALIRYPHGGKFEIPILTVNNKQSAAKKMLGNALDAVGINSKVAERLSGADFDGDTVMVIPTNSKVKISSKPALKGLEGFDPKMRYGYDDIKIDADGNERYYRNGKEFKRMKNTGTEMGKVSNLITDMTLKGANDDELARAVRHSMVVIDAEKHKLDYKQSERDNDISSLKKKYQAHTDDDKYGGASTLISRAKSEVSVTKRKGSPKIDPETGKQYWDEVDDPYYTVTKVNKKTGEVTTTRKKRSQPSTKMAETDDAYTLISDFNTPMERAYADYANQMKALANRARKEMLSTGKIKYSASAKAAYKDEVDSLNAQLMIAKKNAPRERQAQLLAKSEVDAKQRSNPDMTPGEIKKAGQQALTKARVAVGAKRTTIKISDREWEAIQAGAISENILSSILDNTDIDSVRQRATPRASTNLSAAKVNKIKNMNNRGYTVAEIAESLGVSTSTISGYLKGAE